MTIHHDKLAYGRLAKSSEELSEEKLLQMLNELNGEPSEEKENPREEKTEKNKKPSE